MKSSDTELDTKHNSTKNYINLKSKQPKTHMKPTSSDIIDIRVASLQVGDNPLPSDDMTTITKIHTINRTITPFH